MEEKDRLQDIPQFRTLEENLELRVALQQVDKLKAENVALKTELDEIKEEIMQLPGVVARPDEDHEENNYLDKRVIEAMENRAEIEEAREKDEFFTVGDDGCLDFGPPTYEDVVDPEFDRGFKMGQSWLIQDIIQYLKNIRDNGEA